MMVTWKSSNLLTIMACLPYRVSYDSCRNIYHLNRQAVALDEGWN